DVLRRELGVDPDPETKALYRELVQRPATASPPSASAEAPSVTPRTARLLPAEETPLIGRADESRRLAEALDEACRGRGHVATIVGEAGIGKSRLMHALVAGAETRGVRVLEGHAYESEQVLAFGPWVDALRAVDPARDGTVLARLDPVWR